MITTNHALARGLIALAVHQPALAIPLAFLSYFAMDVLPHFGITVQNGNVRARNNKPLFKSDIRADTALVGVSFIVVTIALNGHVAWHDTLACMFAAVLPNLTWVYRFIKELKTGTLGSKSFFSRFHKWIQWGELPWGLIVDMGWFAASLVALVRIAA